MYNNIAIIILSSLLLSCLALRNTSEKKTNYPYSYYVYGDFNSRSFKISSLVNLNHDTINCESDSIFLRFEKDEPNLQIFDSKLGTVFKGNTIKSDSLDHKRIIIFPIVGRIEVYIHTDVRNVFQKEFWEYNQAILKKYDHTVIERHEQIARVLSASTKTKMSDSGFYFLESKGSYVFVKF